MEMESCCPLTADQAACKWRLCSRFFPPWELVGA